jgi:AraC family transcriptional regulator of adaptative response/methylated-DNA-[protein]-cysteine methyltransferase
VFKTDWTQLNEIKLHLNGTPFQLKVWQSLLNIPQGKLTTYGAIAKSIGSPKSSRAVGTAIGVNPIAYLIPCHRVIRSSGEMGGYMWGVTRKSAMIGWEAAKSHDA